jgi:hypothetical protein
VSLALSEENNRLFTYLMRNINDELGRKGMICEGDDDSYIPFSFGKMVSF